jgi:hypothetical protein
MAELVYAHDLKSCLARDAGSTPALGTKFKFSLSFFFCYYLKAIYKIVFPLIAQLVEQSPLKRLVAGSSPAGRTLN